jgi:hypothetical protein
VAASPNKEVRRVVNRQAELAPGKQGIGQMKLKQHRLGLPPGKKGVAVTADQKKHVESLIGKWKLAWGRIGIGQLKLKEYRLELPLGKKGVAALQPKQMFY